MAREPIRREVWTWDDVDKLMDVLLGQLRDAGMFDALMMVTRGGIIPGGLICEEAGARVTNVYGGNDYISPPQSILATTPGIHARMLKELEQNNS